jgi:phage/plasmid-like protein (TIGR03299 family)
MAHNITERDSVISVRDAGWHGLATVLDDYVTPEQAREMAFPWEPVTTPLYRGVPFINEAGEPDVSFEEVPGIVGVERSDTGEFFGSVGKDYVHATNKELTEIAESIEGIDSGAVRVETAGSLKGGRKVWMLLRMAEPIVVKGDPNGATIPYFALQNSHDGYGSLRGQALMTRIICDNTAQAADMEARANNYEFTFRHTTGLRDRIEDAKAALAMWRDSVVNWQALMDELIATPVTEAQKQDFIDGFIPWPVSTMTVGPRVLTNIENARNAFNDIMTGVTTADVSNTAYGLVQAAIEFNQHVRGVRAASDLARAESRFKRAYLDRDRQISVAIDLAREVALA